MSAPAVAATVNAPLTGHAADLGGMAALGKVAFALLVIVAVIFMLVWLLRRFGMGRAAPGQRLRVIAGRALGNREKIMIVEVEDTWLVLGVTPGNVSKLHELPARPVERAGTPPAPDTEGGFARRFAAALKHNLQRGRTS